MAEAIAREEAGEATLNEVNYPPNYGGVSKDLEGILTKLRDLAKEVSFRGVATYLAHASGGMRVADAVRVLSCTEGLSRVIGVAVGIVEAFLKGSLEREEAVSMLEGVKEGLRAVSCPESEASLHLKTYALVNDAVRHLGTLMVRMEYESMLTAGMAAALAAKVAEGDGEVRDVIA